MLIQLGCQSSSSNETLIETKDETPGEWMFQQRAFPYNKINEASIVKGRAYVKQLQSQKRSLDDPWEAAGPINIGGRITDIALHPTWSDILFVGSSVGGVWRSLDAGKNWDVVFEEPGALSIGSIDISKSNPNVIYVGTGEANASATSGAFFGNGMYKSTDSGDSWEHIGLSESHHIGRVIIAPENPDHVFVAVAGALYNKSEDRGLYRTLDGGETWDRVLHVSDSTSCIDVVMNPDNPDILFASTWERIRHPNERSYAGITSRIYRSLDGGETWMHIDNDVPNNNKVGRIGLALDPNEPTTIYATYTRDPVTNKFDGLFKSVNNGNSWVRIDDGSMNSVFSSFGWFFGNVRVHPVYPDSVFVIGISAYASGDGGVSWEQYLPPEVHVDHHAFEIHPLDANFRAQGCDGGLYLSHDMGATWEHVEVLPITQFYTCEIDVQLPHRLYGGMQDNGTGRTPDGNLDDWERILGGDGFYVIVDPTNSDIIYAESQWGNLSKSIDGGESFSWAGVSLDDDDRTNWNTPVVMSPHNPAVIYYGAQRLFRTTTASQPWEPISGDLTDPITSLDEVGTITTIAISESDSNVIYVGSDDGQVSVSMDWGESWQFISDDLPMRYVTRVAVDPYDALSAYVTFSGYRHADYIAHVYHTYDGGETWEDISGNLPDVPVNDIIVDPRIDFTLYIATDLGVWYTNNLGLSWSVLGTDLPSTVVNDLTLHNETRILLAATYGRSMFNYDLGEPSATKDAEKVISYAKVYPNPANSVVNLEVEFIKKGRCQISLMSSSGNLVKKCYDGIVSTGMTSFNFDIDGIPSGNYFIHMHVDGHQSVKPIIIIGS